MVRGTYNQCPGSRQAAKEIVEPPKRWVDEYGYAVGSAGVGICKDCGREIGLQASPILQGRDPNEPGKIALHRKLVVASGNEMR
jgi:hypothetical protein